MLKAILNNRTKKANKIFALLIDPDKHNRKSLTKIIKLADKSSYPNVILVGGSLVYNNIDKTIELIKSLTKKPVYLFPGNSLQVSDYADGILLLSLISGRNAEFLIGNHVLTASRIKESGIEVIPTGYMLINSGVDTSVSYMSNTTPIPYNKCDIAIATALAGELLGLQAIYLESGSGALKPVSSKMITAIKSQVNIPIIVGGGIKNTNQLNKILESGADMVVIGSTIEDNPEQLNDFIDVFKQFNK